MTAQTELFLEQCRQQNVVITSSRLENAITGIMLRDRIYPGFKTGILLGVMAAADSLELQPHRQLTNKVIDPEPFAHDVPSMILADLINVSHGVFQPIQADFHVKSPAKEKEGVCTELETKWNDTFWDIESNEGASPLLQVFTDRNGPAVLRKGHGNATALLLKNVALGRRGIVYPAGSAVQISTPFDRYDTTITPRRLILSATGPEVLPLSVIRAMSFLRLTAYQVPESQRDAHFKGLKERCGTVEDIRRSACTALARPDVVRIGETPLLSRMYQRVGNLLLAR